jgi:hypothetical protein
MSAALATTAADADASGKRALTAAVPDMPIAQQRRGLGELRQSFAEASVDRPFALTRVMSSIGMTFGNFCELAVHGWHQKRKQQHRRHATARRAEKQQRAEADA